MGAAIFQKTSPQHASAQVATRSQDTPGSASLLNLPPCDAELGEVGSANSGTVRRIAEREAEVLAQKRARLAAEEKQASRQHQAALRASRQTWSGAYYRRQRCYWCALVQYKVQTCFMRCLSLCGWQRFGRRVDCVTLAACLYALACASMGMIIIGMVVLWDPPVPSAHDEFPYAVPFPTPPKIVCSDIDSDPVTNATTYFVLIPGFGSMVHLPLLRANLAWLRRQNLRVTCALYVYKTKEEFPLDEEDGLQPCKIIRQEGFWVDFIRTVPPSYWSTADYILIWLDDVVPSYKTNLHRMAEIMHCNGLGVLSPSYPILMHSSHNRHAIMRQWTGIGRQTNFVEFQFSLMTVASFSCLRGMIDPTKTRHGWGLDFLYWRLCHNHCMGVLDEATMVDTRTGSYNNTAAKAEMIAFADMHGGMREEYFNLRILYAPSDPHCNPVSLATDTSAVDAANRSHAVGTSGAQAPSRTVLDNEMGGPDNNLAAMTPATSGALE